MKTARDISQITEIKANILDRALDIICQEGFNSLTMRKLANRGGMTAPNLYNYFANKDEIYISIVIKGFEMLHAQLHQALARYDNVTDQARACIRTYLDFGISNAAYYEIMFTRPTPKYNDYVGTPFEELSSIEYRLSMDIAEVAIKLADSLLPESAEHNRNTLTKRIIQIWSMLHGMVSLHNSNIVEYVAQDADRIYEETVDEIMQIFMNAAK